MEFYNNEAEIFVPDNAPVKGALSRTTHMGIGAHQDDLELMATHGILQCYESEREWFFGVVITDGRGSPRTGPYAAYSDEEIRQIRRQEQKKAAKLGKYGGVALLDYASFDVKNSQKLVLTDELQNLISAARPDVIYTHNLADKHDTHVAVSLMVIEALRKMPKYLHPIHVYGVEVWRGLDWLPDESKVVLDVSANPDLAASLIKVHDSQVAGGKRYDLAVEGRKIANATFAETHAADKLKHALYALDLTSLIHNPHTDIDEFIQHFIHDFSRDVTARIKNLL